MSTVNLTEATFAETVDADGLVLVDLWAEWCGPCKMFAPIFEKVSEAHPDAVFAKVDTEAEQNLAGQLGVMSIPTLMVFRDGILLFNQAGALPEAALEDLVSQAEALDMDQVRSELEASSPSS
ncbi:MAG: thioredoxin [Microthrixaceae bacterium]